MRERAWRRAVRLLQENWCQHPTACGAGAVYFCPLVVPFQECGGARLLSQPSRGRRHGHAAAAAVVARSPEAESSSRPAPARCSATEHSRRRVVRQAGLFRALRARCAAPAQETMSLVMSGRDSSRSAQHASASASASAPPALPPYSSPATMRSLTSLFPQDPSFGPHALKARSHPGTRVLANFDGDAVPHAHAKTHSRAKTRSHASSARLAMHSACCARGQRIERSFLKCPLKTSFLQVP